MEAKREREREKELKWTPTCIQVSAVAVCVCVCVVLIRLLEVPPGITSSPRCALVNLQTGEQSISLNKRCFLNKTTNLKEAPGVT